VAVAAIAAVPPDAGRKPVPADFTSAKSLKEALDVLRDRLARDGKAEYAALLTEERVRAAVRNGIRSYEAFASEQQAAVRGGVQVWAAVRPVFQKVADDGAWPAGCTFNWHFSQPAGGIVYEGFWVRLRASTPNGGGFALPVADLYFGRFAPPQEKGS
jgi:hypothetical protein